MNVITTTGVRTSEPELSDTRRWFLSGAIAGIAGIIAVSLGIPSALYLLKPKQRRQTEWMDAGEFKDDTSAEPREITFRNNRVDGWKVYSGIETAWLSKGADGNLLAFSPWCTHLGCAYRYEPRRSEFTCPCHGSRFSKDGGVIAGPASRPLDRYQIKIVGKRIWLSSPASLRSS